MEIIVCIMKYTKMIMFIFIFFCSCCALPTNTFAFSCQKEWLRYDAQVTMEGSFGRYPNGFYYCHGEWDGETNPTWGRFDSNGDASISVVLCSENHPFPPDKIYAKCIFKDRFDKKPVVEKIYLKPRSTPMPSFPIIVPYTE